MTSNVGTVIVVEPVIAPVTASVDPSNVKLDSAFKAEVLAAVTTLLLAPFVTDIVPVRFDPSPLKAVAVTVPFTFNPSSTVTSVESDDDIVFTFSVSFICTAVESDDEISFTVILSSNAILTVLDPAVTDVVMLFPPANTNSSVFVAIDPVSYTHLTLPTTD